MVPRCLELPELSAVVFAALQYFYTLSLCTPIQHQTFVLIGLLFFSRTYGEPNLRALVAHALHGQVISSASVAAQIYEGSTLGSLSHLDVPLVKLTSRLYSRSKRASDS